MGMVFHTHVTGASHARASTHSGMSGMPGMAGMAVPSPATHDAVLDPAAEPGPVLHGRIGDEFMIRLVNDAGMGHWIDFHAGTLAPDRPMRTIAPGRSLVYRFRATRAGIWMYHCSSMPMPAHIAKTACSARW
jgi:Multicopper oxidase